MESMDAKPHRGLIDLSRVALLLSAELTQMSVGLCKLGSAGQLDLAPEVSHPFAGASQLAGACNKSHKREDQPGKGFTSLWSQHTC